LHPILKKVIFYPLRERGLSSSTKKSQIIIEFSLIFMDICFRQCTHKTDLPAQVPFSGREGNTCAGFAEMGYTAGFIRITALRANNGPYKGCVEYGERSIHTQ